MQYKPLAFVVISILVVALIYGSFPRSDLFAVIVERGPIDCVPFANVDEVQCCQTETDDKGIEIKWCTDCVNTSPPSNCGPRYQEAGIGETPPPAGPSVLPEDGVLEQPPRPPPFDPTAPLQGGVLEQQEQQTPPTFAPGTSPGVLEQLEQSEGFSPGFLERQQLQPSADEETGSEVPRAVEPLPPTCNVPGTVFDPDINECVLENPPELCPDGNIPQLAGPGGTQPECPPSEAEESQAKEPEQSAAEDPEQQLSEEGDGSLEDNGNNNN